VSPVVARIAAEHGIDPSAVPGTGTGGRVTKKDILTFIESGAAAAPRRRSGTRRRRPSPAPRACAAPASQPPRRAAPARRLPASRAGSRPRPGAHRHRCRRRGTGSSPAEQPRAEQGAMTAMRKGIAEHMRRSLDTSAHVTSAIEVDMSASWPSATAEAGVQKGYGVSRPT
jgi:pyruvate/2-oxoglutarate dehydrogenase complex dihydrolipoamide acyltransferase (E2) component